MKLCRFRGRERQMEEGSFDRLNMQQCDASGVRVWWWGEISKEWRRRIKWAVGVRGVNVRPFWFCVCVVGELKKKREGRRVFCVNCDLIILILLKKYFLWIQNYWGTGAFCFACQFSVSVCNWQYHWRGSLSLSHTINLLKVLLYYKFKIS